MLVSSIPQSSDTSKKGKGSKYFVKPDPSAVGGEKQQEKDEGKEREREKGKEKEKEKEMEGQEHEHDLEMLDEEDSFLNDFMKEDRNLPDKTTDANQEETDHKKSDGKEPKEKKKFKF